MREIIFDKEKEIRVFWAEGFELDDEAAIRESIIRATGDLMARTLKVKLGQNWKVEDRLTDKDAEDNLVKRIHDYFQEPSCCDPQKFMDWHNKTCIYILKILESKYIAVHYGKAQKLLNMTFKNLYCTRYGEREEYFEYCHMPLDSYTLEWIFRNIYSSVSPRPTKEKTPSWSNFSYKKCAELDDNGKYTYNHIEDLVDKYFNDYRSEFNSTLTALQAEFVIWKEIQLEMAAEGFYSQLLANFSELDKKQKMKNFRENKNLQEKLCYVKNFLNNNML